MHTLSRAVFFVRIEEETKAHLYLHSPYKHMYIFICIYICMHICNLGIHKYKYTYMDLLLMGSFIIEYDTSIALHYIYTCIYNLHIHKYAYTCLVYIYIYVHIYVYMYIPVSGFTIEYDTSVSFFCLRHHIFLNIRKVVIVIST
jgi:hypothetical protein